MQINLHFHSPCTIFAKKRMKMKRTTLIDEQETMPRSSIRLLMNSGRSMEEIAQALDKDIDTVKRLSK